MNFTFKLKKIASIALITALAFNLSSCDKEDNVTVVQLQDSKATVKTSTIYVPSKSTVYYDLVNDREADAATGTINLSGMYGSTLKANAKDYKFGYFDLKGKTINDIKVSDLKSLDFKATTLLSIDASSAGAPASSPTWIIYDSPNNHAVYPTADRFVVLYKGTTLSENSDEVIIFIADDVIALNGNATYTLKVKRFVK